MKIVPIDGQFARKLGANIRTARLERKLSQGEVEKRSGLLRCYQSRVENGYTLPYVSTLEKLADAIGVPMVTLFPRAEISAENAAFLKEIGSFDLKLDEQRQLARMLRGWTR